MSKAVRDAILKALGKKWRTTSELLPEVREALGHPTLNKRLLSDDMRRLEQDGEVESEKLGHTWENGSPKRYRATRFSSRASKP